MVRSSWSAVCAAAGVGVGVVATYALLGASSPASRSSGDVVAKRPMGISLGEGTALLDPGAHLTWTQRTVRQQDGRATYVTAADKPLDVETPAGDVHLAPATHAIVKVRLDARGKALVFVEVDEGKAEVGPRDHGLALRAGEHAALDSGGPRPSGDEKSFDEAASEGEKDDAFEEANEKLVDQIRDYKKKLDETSAHRHELERKLKETEEKLAAKEGKRARNEFDLTPEDWRELADHGMVKYRMPCPSTAAYAYSPQTLSELGLSPQDGPTLSRAHQRSVEQTWNAIRSICGEVLRAPPEVIESIGLSPCLTIIEAKDAENKPIAEVNEPYAKVAAMRAGRIPMPGAADHPSPLVRALLVMTGANADFEADLARSLGPEEAHRLAFSGPCQMAQILQEGRDPSLGP